MTYRKKPAGGYGGISIPRGAIVPNDDMSELFCAYLRETYDTQAAPSVKFPNAEILLPKHDLSFALVPGDLELRDEEDGFDDEVIFDNFFEQVEGSCFFWNSYGLIDLSIIFVAPYSFEKRTWMMNARFKDNLGITSIDRKFSIISNIFFKYSIVSGSREFVDKFNLAWGGKDKLENDFVEYLDSQPRDENWKWAMQNLMPLLNRK